MATTKNINMKSYNGTDYDTLYPATQTSQVLGNWNLTKVSGLLSTAFGGTGVTSLEQLALNLGLDNKYLRGENGSYVGTGTSGQYNPNSITFNFCPEVVFLNNSVFWMTPLTSDTTGMRFTLSGKTLSWYTTQISNPEAHQYNVQGQTYNYYAIGKNVLNTFVSLITTSGTVTLPVTGDYYLELHGGGGGSDGYNDMSGGGSGQVYNSVRLTAGEYQVTIGSGGNALYSAGSQVKDGESTTFGTYTVAGGKKSVNSASGVAGVGNVGGASQQLTRAYAAAENGGGVFPYYGGGATCSYVGGEGVYQRDATNGAVYIYLIKRAN